LQTSTRFTCSNKNICPFPYNLWNSMVSEWVSDWEQFSTISWQEQVTFKYIWYITNNTSSRCPFMIPVVPLGNIHCISLLSSFTNALNWLFIVLVHWGNSPHVEMSRHSYTLSWCRSNQSNNTSSRCPFMIPVVPLGNIHCISLLSSFELNYFCFFSIRSIRKTILEVFSF
jgi:hypothetical protein